MSWGDAMGALNRACLDTFGRQVTYRPAAVAPVLVTGIVQTGAQLEGRAPGVYVVLFLRASDLPSAVDLGDAVEIDGASYRVFEVEADAGGGVKLALRKE